MKTMAEPKSPKVKTAKKAKRKKAKSRKDGRPKFDLNLDIVKKLSRIHCTQEEIASFVGCCVDTLTRNKEFCKVYKSEKDHGKISLRRHQWKNVEAGSIPMQIFLGKNLLGQSDDPVDMDEQVQANPINIILNFDDEDKKKQRPKTKKKKTKTKTKKKKS